VLLPRETFARGAVEVAPTLLGCVLEHQTAEGLVAVALTEVEAYHGEADPASHAYRGRTARNGVMFGPPGHAYVYFTYGMHFCVNLVCQPEGIASAVLLRAGRVIEGAELAASRRAAGREPGGRGAPERDLARGPARLCKALGITRTQDGADICDPASPLRVRWPADPVASAYPAARTARHAGAARPAGATRAAAGSARCADGPADAGAGGVAVPDAAGPDAAGPGISHGPRIGISVATEVPWRFWLTGDPTVSVYRPHTPRRSRAGRQAAN
jgi:DNA-3-methyladenine glycosylase